MQSYSWLILLAVLGILAIVGALTSKTRSSAPTCGIRAQGEEAAKQRIFSALELPNMRPSNELAFLPFAGGFWSQTWTNGVEEATFIWDGRSHPANRMPSYCEDCIVTVKLTTGEVKFQITNPYSSKIGVYVLIGD